MDDGSKRCNKQKNDGIIDSSSYIICGREEFDRRHKIQVGLVRHNPLGESTDASDVEVEVVVNKVNDQARLMSPLKKNVAPAPVDHQATNPNPIRAYLEPYCKSPYSQVKMVGSDQQKKDPSAKLKGSTRKLLYLIEDIQSKTYSKDLPPPNTDGNEPIHPTGEFLGTKISSIVDGTEQALQQLEAQTKTLNSIYIQDEDNDCSIFKRLTRKCTCLNRTNYNDLMIQFNEETKYVTTPIGELIKNIRIVKKFLYMGGTYTKNALLFLNEAFEKSEHAERVEITLGCSHADLCNVFENQTIVTVCISWPQKYTNFADNFTQVLAASFLYQFAKLEEGRRYLKYTTKITNDIKRALRKGGSKIGEDVIQTLKATLNLIVPPTPQNVSVVYSRHNDEGKFKNISTETIIRVRTKHRKSLENPRPSQNDFTRNVKENIDGLKETDSTTVLDIRELEYVGKVKESINGLHQFRQYMTLEEVTMYLDLLTHFSHPGTAKTDLTTYLPDLLLLFKQMLKEYDNSEINILITNILNNIVSNSKNNVGKKEKEPDESLPMIVADTATEPIETMSVITQMPQIPIHGKKPFNKFRQVSRYKDFLNRSQKFAKGAGAGIIVVPVEKRTQLKSKEPIL